MINLTAKRTLSVLGLTISVSVALIVLFVLCALAGLVFPDVQATHAWVTLFTLAPVSSPQASRCLPQPIATRQRSHRR